MTPETFFIVTQFLFYIAFTYMEIVIMDMYDRKIIEAK